MLPSSPKLPMSIKLVVLLLLSTPVSALRREPLLKLRGGGSIIRKPSRPVAGHADVLVPEERWSFGDSHIKVRQSWSGDIADLAIGTLIGLGGGIITGRWARWAAKTMTESVVGVPVFIFSHVIFLITVNIMLFNAKILTINYTRLGTSGFVLSRVKPLARRLDRDGDGQLTWTDLEMLISKVLGNRIGKWLTNFLKQTGFDQDGDGAFTHKDVMLILGGNQHGALGLKFGAATGLLIGCFAPLLPFHSAAIMVAKAARAGVGRTWHFLTSP